MGKTVSIFNQKGGVGKTTTCVNFAAALGNKGKKTLLVDVDPQGNTTSGVGIDKAVIANSTYDMLINKVPARDIMMQTEFSNLYVLPATMNLAGAELELAEADERYTALKKGLAPIVAEFDYIIIDCPPSLGLLSLNALTASDTLIVPLQCEYYALEGLSQLVSTVRTVKQYYNEHLELEGVVYTMYDSRLKLTQQVIDEVNKYFPNKAYKTMIPRSVKLAEAPSYGMPVIYYEKYSKASFEYKKFADEFLKKQKKW
ncbi:MAG: AAA family ATPase [Eubacterium sp.]|nr:AAA family ATPase [Eubacterium sp.]